MNPIDSADDRAGWSIAERQREAQRRILALLRKGFEISRNYGIDQLEHPNGGVHLSSHGTIETSRREENGSFTRFVVPNRSRQDARAFDDYLATIAEHRPRGIRLGLELLGIRIMSLAGISLGLAFWFFLITALLRSCSS